MKLVVGRDMIHSMDPPPYNTTPKIPPLEGLEIHSSEGMIVLFGKERKAWTLNVFATFVGYENFTSKGKRIECTA